MKSIIRWAISNSPAMNIVMVAGMLVGVFAVQALHRDTFPEFELDMITVSVPYPGATPEEVEEGICQKIEEAVRSVNGIKKINSTASEGNGSVMLELRSDVSNSDRVLNDVRSAVDQIPSFPVLAEDPDVKLTEMRETVIRVGIVGPNDRDQDAALRLREVAEQTREALLQLPEISRVDLTGGKEYQIDIEIPEGALRSYGVSLQQLAEVVRRENVELPGGTIRAKSQEVLLRGHNRRLTGREIAELPLITHPDGAVLTIGDVGTVRDAFADRTAISELDGLPVLVLSVQRDSSEDLFRIVDAVKSFAAEHPTPAGYEVVTWADRSTEVRGRVELLLSNGLQGLVIVFVLLAVFLELRLAFWIALGIPFSLLVSGAFMYFTGQTLNMISMFAFIMALGIVVDDAIVVGENIFAHREMGKSLARAAMDGAWEVAPSVLASVSTTMIAFAPLLFVSGMMGKVVMVLPTVVIAMLFVSLVESITILPCHLSHHDSLVFRALHIFFYVFAWMVNVARAVNRWANAGLQTFIRTVYRPSLKLALNQRMIFLAGCLSLLVLVLTLVRSGAIPMVFFPKLDSNSLVASVTFPDGTPESITDRWTEHLEKTFWEVDRELQSEGGRVGVRSYRVVGSQIVSRGRPGGAGSVGGMGNKGSVEIEIVDATKRSVKSDEIVARWREKAGRIPGTESLSFGAQAHGPGGPAIEFKLTAQKHGERHLDAAVDEIKKTLAQFPGVFDVSDDSLPGKWEFRLRIKNEARAMGVRAADLAETVRASYYGQEVMRLQRGRHEVKLMVRYPRDDRRSLAAFNEIRVRTDDGVERPLTELAEVEVERGYSTINRLDQRRSVTVTADVEESAGNARKIVADLKANGVPKLLASYPGLDVNWEGQQEQQQESFQSMFVGFAVAVMVMYVLLAFEFKSYVQPLLILAIIPFGMIGAVFGHGLLGIPLTIFSMFGLVALTGIVINDSIVLVDFINHRCADGLPVRQAIVDAGCRRLRPVMLTTVTTVGGLTPILLEKSFQAQFLIPMATSIAFGEIFATVIVLYLVPVLYSLYDSSTKLVGSDDEDVEHLAGPASAREPLLHPAANLNQPILDPSQLTTETPM